MYFSRQKIGETVGRTDGRSDVQTKWKSNGRTFGRSDKRTVGRPDRLMRERMVARSDGRTYYRTDERNDWFATWSSIHIKKGSSDAMGGEALKMTLKTSANVNQSDGRTNGWSDGRTKERFGLSDVSFGQCEILHYSQCCCWCKKMCVQELWNVSLIKEVSSMCVFVNPNMISKRTCMRLGSLCSAHSSLANALQPSPGQTKIAARTHTASTFIHHT